MNKMGFEAIILAGGFGTRLRSITGDELPKPLVDVVGKPFLAHLMDYLARQGCTRFILATGHRHELIAAAFGNSYRAIPISYSVEHSPLGTGGAVRQAVNNTEGDDVAVVNGDTFFAVDFNQMFDCHVSSGALVTIALKYMERFDRYGAVGVDEGIITKFEEKGVRTSGLINGGIYLMNRKIFPLLDAAGLVFSLEKDILQKHVAAVRPAAFISDGYFIDIGIPDDYRRACNELTITHEDRRGGIIQ